jgi:hypothetical protein
MMENVSPFGASFEAITAADLLRLEVIEAAATIHRAAGMLPELNPAMPAGLQMQLMLDVISGGVDLVGLECVGSDFTAVVTGFEGRLAPFDDLVLLDPGEPIDVPAFVTGLCAERWFLRVPGSRETGLAATLEALRVRLRARLQEVRQ